MWYAIKLQEKSIRMHMAVLAASNLSSAEVWMKTSLVTSDVRSFYPPLQPESAHSWHDPAF
jgi:hypothetical protein